MSYILIIKRVFKRGYVGGLWGCREGSLNEHGAVLGATTALARLTRIETYILFKVIQLNVKFIRTINNFKTLVARMITKFVFNFRENIPMRALRISRLYRNIRQGFLWTFPALPFSSFSCCLLNFFQPLYFLSPASLDDLNPPVN